MYVYWHVCFDKICIEIDRNRVISYLLNLLEKEESLRGECAVALAIIFERGCVEKLSSEAYKVLHKSHKKDTTSFLQEWKNGIVEQVSKACSPQWEVSKYFQVQLC